MKKGGEWRLAEKPTIEGLKALGYQYLSPDLHHTHRDGDNQVILRPILIKALQQINKITKEDATAAYFELLNKNDNAEWTNILRGDYSRTVSGNGKKKSIKIIDFFAPENNTFTVTNQLYVKAQKSRIPDIVVYINGIPVVVIEAKSPLNHKDKTGEAFEQIKQYERDIPRLFYTNAFAVLTDGTNCLYGATGSPSQYYGTWKDPYPKTANDFADALSRGLWSLLEPARLLDLIAHFIVFETDDGKTVKKICRYHQFRAVNKMVDRVVDGDHKQGLVWHTQGSGKSLSMVFAALKLKTHLTIKSPQLHNPNIMVLTDRIDLDDQISKTFQACKLPNPDRMNAVSDIHKTVHSGSDGLTILSTIFKFQGSRKPVENSHKWIVLVDECHRTQEKDLGAFLRATLPHAMFFGFTGTPIKKTDKDTYRNFGVDGEGYLDKYGIDDAVADGATVPIFYTSRKADWQIDEGKLDILFDQWFGNLPQPQIDKIKERGVTLADIVKHPQRIDLITYDIWTHFKQYAQPDGLKAQIVAYDREAVVLYKQALDKVIAEDFHQQGIAIEKARSLAATQSACVYSASQEDEKPSEDPHVAKIRHLLNKNYLDREAETAIKKQFGKKRAQPNFLIVCDKLLTGFDAPIEGVMYLDKPLKEHNLLQAIARTNRVYKEKRNGLIVDYIGVSKNLNDALSSYRNDDVKNAMQDLDNLRSQLRTAHAAVKTLMKGIKRNTNSLKGEYDALVKSLGTEDRWFTFRRKAQEFIKIYSALSPDPYVLDFSHDLKWISGFIHYATQVFEKKEYITIDSNKIRRVLEEHLKATGISTLVKLRHITNPNFWDDFDQKGKSSDDLQTAAIRKATELKKITTEKVAENEPRYGKFSERVLEILKKFEQGQIDAATTLKNYEQVAKDLDAEDKAHEESGMPPAAYGIYKIIESYSADMDDDLKIKFEQLAIGIHDLYNNDQTAPKLWQEKEQLKKSLRQQVRKLVHPLKLKEWKSIPEKIEEFALKNFIKV
ncbi:MAG: HsdR family type I site-specific deoxyribonuclease [Magnetococcales bacterium]|nr:HsdR family type I site-specific deoxyribonuclease [Magnetococcales bacterium]